MVDIHIRGTTNLDANCDPNPNHYAILGMDPNVLGDVGVAEEDWDVVRLDVHRHHRLGGVGWDVHRHRRVEDVGWGVRRWEADYDNTIRHHQVEV